jgi:surface polysaccharide O-acyltransferase-like enzyme
LGSIQDIDSRNKIHGGFPLPVDLIRTVAITMVLVYHAITEPYNAALLSSTQYSVLWLSSTIYESFVIMGVPLFVMLSGSLLLQPSKVNEPIRVFLKKRLGRIGLAFLFWSAIYLVWNYYVIHKALTVNSVIQMFLSGGVDYQFWFIYLIMGLYLITPILRIVVAYADRKVLRYLIILWFIGVGLIPLFHLISGFSLDNNLFLVGGYIGYFVLGFYLIGNHVRTKLLKWLLAGSIIWTIIGAYLMAYLFHSLNQYYFFFDTLSANVIIASIVVCMLLSKFPSDWPGKSHPKLSRLMHVISLNTLPIYFFHVIVLETLNMGFLGFKLSLTVISPVIEIPLAAAATLFLTLGLILLMKKVPILRKLIG